MWLLHWKGRVLATGPLGSPYYTISPQSTGWQHACANSSLWNIHSHGFISLLFPYLWCISLLLNHVHSRQLAKGHLPAAGLPTWVRGQDAALSGETDTFPADKLTPPSFCFVSRSRITRTEGHFPYLVSHMQVLEGVWRNVKMCCAQTLICVRLSATSWTVAW